MYREKANKIQSNKLGKSNKFPVKFNYLKEPGERKKPRNAHCNRRGGYERMRNASVAGGNWAVGVPIWVLRHDKPSQGVPTKIEPLGRGKQCRGVEGLWPGKALKWQVVRCMQTDPARYSASKIDFPFRLNTGSLWRL